MTRIAIKKVFVCKVGEQESQYFAQTIR